MESRNPVFGKSSQWSRNGDATFDVATPNADQLAGMYGAPSATPAQTGRMTLDDVVVRTASLFAVLLAGAGVAWLGGFGLLPALGAGLVAMVLGIWAQASSKVRPGVMFAYAALEGVFVGSISSWYTAAFGNGIVPQAVGGTLAAFAAMLLAYKTGFIRATPRFTRILVIAGLGYLVFGLVNLALSLAGVGNLYAGGGIVAVLVSAAGVVLASLFLVLDFDQIERGLRMGLPRREAWRAGFGLMVTLVWLYLEILRLVAILRGDD